jgi:hypothetical protein
MFKTILNATAVFGRSKFRNAAIAAAALACTAAAPAAAMAHHHGFHVDVVVPGPEICVPAPQCDPTPERVWVPAEYRTVTERVWVEPVTTIRVERFDVPAQYGWRDVVYYDRYGRQHCDRQQVLISPARCEERSVPVVVCPGHFEQQTHQQVVCEGHWESRVDRATAVIEAPHVRLEIPLPF